jgi:hypothetical protein
MIAFRICPGIRTHLYVRAQSDRSRLALRKSQGGFQAPDSPRVDGSTSSLATMHGSHWPQGECTMIRNCLRIGFVSGLAFGPFAVVRAESADRDFAMRATCSLRR